jgi:hypothetical protein
MDPITTALISAVAAGAGSGATDIAKKAIAEDYEDLKALLKSKFGHNSRTADAIEKFQDTPDSPKRQDTLQELKAVNASADPELMSAAQSLLELINALPQGGTQDTNDKQQMKPMVEAIGEQAGLKPEEVLTDRAYCSEANLKYLERKHIEGFIATDRESYRDRQQVGRGGRCRKGRRGWTGCAANCRPRRERPSTLGARP